MRTDPLETPTRPNRDEPYGRTSRASHRARPSRGHGSSDRCGSARAEGAGQDASPPRVGMRGIGRARPVGAARTTHLGEPSPGRQVTPQESPPSRLAEHRPDASRQSSHTGPLGAQIASVAQAPSRRPRASRRAPRNRPVICDRADYRSGRRGVVRLVTSQESPPDLPSPRRAVPQTALRLARPAAGRAGRAYEPPCHRLAASRRAAWMLDPPRAGPARHQQAVLAFRTRRRLEPAWPADVACHRLPRAAFRRGAPAGARRPWAHLPAVQASPPPGPSTLCRGRADHWARSPRRGPHEPRPTSRRR